MRGTPNLKYCDKWNRIAFHIVWYLCSFWLRLVDRCNIVCISLSLYTGMSVIEWGTCVMIHDGWHNNYTEHKWNSHLQTCKWGGFVILWHKCCTKNKMPCEWWIWGLASCIEICYMLYIVLRTQSRNIRYVWMDKQEWNVDKPSIVLYTWSYLLWGRLGAWLVYHQYHFVSTSFLCGKILSAVILACHKSLSNSGGRVWHSSHAAGLPGLCWGNWQTMGPVDHKQDPPTMLCVMDSFLASP